MKTKQIKLSSSGFSHHMLLPLLAIMVVGLIGTMTLKFSSAATYDGACTKKSLSSDSKGTCVKYIQTIVGTTSDGIYGPKTKAAVKSMTGVTSVAANSTAWSTICNTAKAAGSGEKYKAYQKACITVSYKTRVCTYTTPSVKTVPPPKPQCPYAQAKTYKTAAAVKKQQTKNNKLAEKYKTDYTAYLKAIKTKITAEQRTKLEAEFKLRYDAAIKALALIQKVDSNGAVL